MSKCSAFIILLLIMSTSGCHLLTVEHHNQAMTAISETESSLQEEISKLNLTLNEQQTTILNLSTEVQALTTHVRALTSAHELAKAKPEEKTKIVYIEKEVPSTRLNNKVILGEKEWVWIDAANTNFHARIDTGATTSSLNAKNIEEFERDGKNWVRFDLVYSHDKDIHEMKLEAPLVRWVRIRQSSNNDLERRPVISLRIRIGDLNEKAQFTLADRSHMQFPVLLGREFFKDIAVVDVSRSYIHEQTDVNQ